MLISALRTLNNLVLAYEVFHTYPQYNSRVRRSIFLEGVFGLTLTFPYFKEVYSLQITFLVFRATIHCVFCRFLEITTA